MGARRTVDCDFWKNDQIREGSKDVKIVAAWLLFNDDTKFSGLFRLSYDNCCQETGLTVEEISAALSYLSELQDDGEPFVRFDAKLRIVWLVKHLEREFPKRKIGWKQSESGGQIGSVLSDVRRVEKSPLALSFCERYAEWSPKIEECRKELLAKWQRKNGNGNGQVDESSTLTPTLTPTLSVTLRDTRYEIRESVVLPNAVRPSYGEQEQQYVREPVQPESGPAGGQPPAGPVETAKPPKPKPRALKDILTEEQVARAKLVIARLEKCPAKPKVVFKGWDFLQRCTNQQCPADVAITVLRSVVEKWGTIEKTPWAYAQRVFDLEYRQYRIDLQVREHEKIKNAPSTVGDILLQAMQKAGAGKVVGTA